MRRRENQTKKGADPLKVAVTGSAGSGKTSVCNRLKELGIKPISSDGIAREAVAPGSPAHKAIVDYFGRKVLKPDRSLDRKLLRRMIINDDTARRALEQMIHPEILKQMKQKMMAAEKDGAPVILVEVPLLFELELANQFDVVVMVAAGHDVKVQRLMDRDKVTRSEAKALLCVQMSDKEKIEQSDFVIENNGPKESMINAVDLLYRKLYQKITKST